MSRYIDADEAIKVMACEMYAEAQSQGYDVDGVEDFIPEATAWMNDAPSIDIVRCKECKWMKVWADGEQTCRRIGIGYIVDDDDYCSYGEREGE